MIFRDKNNNGLILPKINSLREGIWSLRKLKVISAMCPGSGIDRGFTDLLIRYRVYKLNGLRDFLRLEFGFNLS